VALRRDARCGDVPLLLLKENFGWRVVDFEDDIAGLEVGQKAALDDPVSGEGRRIEGERLVALVEPSIPQEGVAIVELGNEFYRREVELAAVVGRKGSS